MSPKAGSEQSGWSTPSPRTGESGRLGVGLVQTRRPAVLPGPRPRDPAPERPSSLSSIQPSEASRSNCTCCGHRQEARLSSTHPQATLREGSHALTSQASCTLRAALGAHGGLTRVCSKRNLPCRRRRPTPVQTRPGLNRPAAPLLGAPPHLRAGQGPGHLPRSQRPRMLPQEQAWPPSAILSPWARAPGPWTSVCGLCPRRDHRGPPPHE